MPKPPSPISPVISSPPMTVPSGSVWPRNDELLTKPPSCESTAIVGRSTVRSSSSGGGRELIGSTCASACGVQDLGDTTGAQPRGIRHAGTEQRAQVEPERLGD